MYQVCVQEKKNHTELVCCQEWKEINCSLSCFYIPPTPLFTLPSIFFISSFPFLSFPFFSFFFSYLFLTPTLIVVTDTANQCNQLFVIHCCADLFVHPLLCLLFLPFATLQGVSPPVGGGGEIGSKEKPSGREIIITGKQKRI